MILLGSDTVTRIEGSGSPQQLLCAGPWIRSFMYTSCRSILKPAHLKDEEMKAQRRVKRCILSKAQN